MNIIFEEIITQNTWKLWTKSSIKSNTSQKLRKAQKNHLCERSLSDEFQSSLQIWPLLKKCNFWHIFLDANNSKTRYRKNLRHGLFFHFSTLRIFYVKMTTSECGRGSTYPSLWQGRRPLYDSTGQENKFNKSTKKD